MVKLSKACLPCRLKRTKCDRLLPSCTQCIRKNRVCTGYRNETDFLFKNETPAIVQRTKRKQSQEDYDATSFYLAKVPPPPSRRAVINDEAMVHYMGLYNDKVIAASGPLCAGFDYLTGVVQSDLQRGGPVAEMATACGLASLGNSTGSEELIRRARIRHVGVLQLLAKQLQDKNFALSDSSITTCILLATYEIIIADNAVPNGPYMTHLFGAVKLLALRGQSQLQTNLGYSIWLKLRNTILLDCLRLREPLPAPISHFIALDALSQKDFNPDFFMIIDQLCTLRSTFKTTDPASPSLLQTTRQLKQAFETRVEWILDHVSAKRPDASSLAHQDNAETTYRFFSVATAWLFLQCIRLIFSDLILTGARAQHMLSPSPLTLSSLEREEAQFRHCSAVVADSVAYFLDHFAANQTAARIHGGIYMLWPLGLFLSFETVDEERLRWIVGQGSRISDAFSLRMGNILAEAAEARLRGLGKVLPRE